MSEQKDTVKIIPCSGIGKVFGLMAREAALYVTEELSPDTTETVCLAHLVTGDEEAVCKVKDQPCITIDGCAALCAAKSVEYAGGNVVEKFRSVDEMKNHRGKKAGDGSELSEDGWMIIKELAQKVSARALQAKEDD